MEGHITYEKWLFLNDFFTEIFFNLLLYMGKYYLLAAEGTKKVWVQLNTFLLPTVGIGYISLGISATAWRKYRNF